MWVTKLLLPPVKKRIFCAKMTKLSPKLALLSIAGSFGALLVGWLVVVARAVSRKTPIYFIIILTIGHHQITHHDVSTGEHAITILSENKYLDLDGGRLVIR